MNAVQHLKEISRDKEVVKTMLEKYTESLSDMGDNFRANCPIHHGDNPTSFIWSIDNGLWFCHSGDCGGGDIFDLIAQIYEINMDTNFRTVINKTAEELNVDISHLEMGERASRNVKETRMWIEYMLGNKKKENTPYDLSKIGVLTELPRYRNFTKETIDYFGGAYSTVYERISVPLKDSNGVVVGTSLRRCNSAEKSKWIHLPKYLNTRLIIYNQENVTGRRIRLVEGAFDVWNLWQLGVQDVGATLGSHVTKEQEELILRNYTDVQLIMDNDKAGIKATKKIIEQLKNKTNLTIKTLGKYKDPGEIPDKETFLELKVLKPYEFLKIYS